MYFDIDVHNACSKMSSHKYIYFVYKSNKSVISMSFEGSEAKVVFLLTLMSERKYDVLHFICGDPICPFVTKIILNPEFKGRAKRRKFFKGTDHFGPFMHSLYAPIK